MNHTLMELIADVNTWSAQAQEETDPKLRLYYATMAIAAVEEATLRREHLFGSVSFHLVGKTDEYLHWWLSTIATNVLSLCKQAQDELLKEKAP